MVTAGKSKQTANDLFRTQNNEELVQARKIIICYPYLKSKVALTTGFETKTEGHFRYRY